MNENTSDGENQDWEKILDGIDFNGTPDKEMPLEETLKPPLDPRTQSLIDKQVEKTEKWLQKNHPPKPPKTKEPRQLKEDPPDSGTFI